MRVAALAGAWQATDYLFGRKPIAPQEIRKNPTESFKDVLEKEMKGEKIDNLFERSYHG